MAAQKNISKSFIYSAEAASAIKAQNAIVALESTVITHGLPQPENFQLAQRLEGIVREGGATPATIAVIDGGIHIGLDEQKLQKLSGAKNAIKLSSRDIAKAVVQKKYGGTTVAATLRLAELAGIRVFSTGGIGGVHRGSNWDVSADLNELAKRKLVCVCAGAKAILDLPATLEQFETLGVPVLSFGTDEFPAFYSRSSGLLTNNRVDSVAEIFEFAQTHWRLGGQGILLTVPIPEEDEIPSAEVGEWISQAHEEMAEATVSGAASTPFLLKRLGELSQGRTLASNLALLENNAQIATKLAMQDWNAI